ncbi:unnamed protein product [Cyprideis torosa]|uniref:Uncharacterized protein n=1 Tax=Cyprideis torosa TaxID=163714 RepID=A0A7R8WI79_9CRUS|nr:unnamed protein product [Cyprideis torosa]CAG0900404.1 unnamed protein product [Cyprideis torosa]
MAVRLVLVTAPAPSPGLCLFRNFGIKIFARLCFQQAGQNLKGVFRGSLHTQHAARGSFRAETGRCWVAVISSPELVSGDGAHSVRITSGGSEEEDTGSMGWSSASEEGTSNSTSSPSSSSSSSLLSVLERPSLHAVPAWGVAGLLEPFQLVVSPGCIPSLMGGPPLVQCLKGRGELQRNHERIFGQPVVAELANISHVLCVHRDFYKNQHGCVLLYNLCESYNTV